MNLRALNFSTIFTMVLITLMTIFGELYKPLKDFLAKIGTHHWIGKGITALIFFIILYRLKRGENDGRYKYADDKYM